MNKFVKKLLHPSAKKTALYLRASELQRQADLNKEYASAALRTFAATGRESSLRAEARFLAVAKHKEEQVRRMLDKAINAD